MTSVPLAKFLLLIALSLGPRDAHTVFATSNSDNYVWTDSGNGWRLRTKGLPSTDWQERTHVKEQPDLYREREMRAIARHDWSEGAFFNLQDGSRLEKQGNAVFYIVDPGAANQKIYTILFPRDSD